jgi:hypothetical protein
MARQHVAKGAAEIIDDEGRAVQRVDGIGGEIGRLTQQQLRQAVTTRAGPHLLRRQRRENMARPCPVARRSSMLTMIDAEGTHWR